MAAPLVAGAVALYLEKFPTATCDDLAGLYNLNGGNKVCGKVVDP
jgi:hypothetical protein